MRVVISVWGRFHLFHLARHLDRHGDLARIFSTYPAFKLRGEGLPPEKIVTNPWLHAPLLAKWRVGLRNDRLDRRWLRLMDAQHNRFLARHIPPCDVLVALSGSGAAAGPLVQARGGRWICDRSSSHISYADRLLSEEFARYGAPYRAADPWALDKELLEYAQSDLIVVPSEYARRSFIAMGVSADKIAKVSFGGDLEIFRPVAEPDPAAFTVLYCGQVGFRKGIPDLLQAFERVKHPRKKLVIAGAVAPEIRGYLSRAPLGDVEFIGRVDRAALPGLYSRANVFALASIEEGMALVQMEAMACGTPVVTTNHTGGDDVITDGVEGFIVPIRAPAVMAERLQRFADTPDLSKTMGTRARARIQSLGGWESYGRSYREIITALVRSANGELSICEPDVRKQKQGLP